MSYQEIISAILCTVWFAKEGAAVWSCSALTGPIANISGGIVNTDVVFNVGVKEDDDLATTHRNCL